MPDKPEITIKSNHPALIVARLVLVGLFIQWVRLMSGLSFTWTIRLGYILIALCVLETWFEPALKRKWLRPALTIVIVVWALWFTESVTMARPDLEYHAWTIGGDYKDGDVVGGIKWRPAHFTDLRFSITNHSDDDYENLSITFSPDKQAVGLGQITSLPGVAFINHNAIAEAHTSGVGPDGKQFEQQFELNIVNPEVTCSRLGSGQTLQIVMAIANAMGPDFPDDLYGPKVRVGKMHIKVRLWKGPQPLSIERTIDVPATA